MENKTEERGFKLNLSYIFGSYGSKALKDGVFYGDEEGQSLIYPSGRFITVRNLENED